MGCGGSSGNYQRIEMKKTKISELDDIFKDAQDLIDKIYELKDPIEDAKDRLLADTGFSDVECATIQHAAVGIIFAMYASTKSPAELVDAFKITTTSPFLDINKDLSPPNIADSIQYFKDYVKALIKANEKVTSLAEKVKEIAEKVPDLPEKAKDSISNSNDLGAMDK